MMIVLAMFAAMLGGFEFARWLERCDRREREGRRAMATRPRSTRAGRVP